jgi:hypothetical protein
MVGSMIKFVLFKRLFQSKSITLYVKVMESLLRRGSDLWS